MAGAPVKIGEFVEDRELWPIALDLLECLEQQLTKRGLREGLCMVHLAPGQGVDSAFIEPGVGYVRLDSAFPSTTFPTPADPSQSCSAALAATFELGVMRCIKVYDSKRTPALEAAEQVRLQLADMAAMRAAATCCARKDHQIALNTYTPYGPEGGLYGGFFTISAQIGV